MASKLVNNIRQVKPVDLILKQSGDNKHGLKRTLTAFSITLLGVGAIVGTGIFVLTGVAAAKYVGPGLIFSFIVAGIVSGLAAIVMQNLLALYLSRVVHIPILMQRSVN